MKVNNPHFLKFAHDGALKALNRSSESNILLGQGGLVFVGSLSAREVGSGDLKRSKKLVSQILNIVNIARKGSARE